MSFNETKKIRAALILEVIGRPPEHLTETLEALIKQMGEEKGVKVVSKKINPPAPLKNQKDFYCSFAEVEVEVEDILYIAILMFKYMPSHIEIISPQSISLSNAEWSDIFSELTRRLHGYEEITRILQSERAIMERRLKEALESSGKASPKTEGEKKKSKKEKKIDE